MTGNYTVGRLMCGTFRGILERAKFDGAPIDWHESSGWIERVFRVRADPDIHRQLIGFIERLNNDQVTEEHRP
jgi:hypothetical protein